MAKEAIALLQDFYACGNPNGKNYHLSPPLLLLRLKYSQMKHYKRA